MIPKVIWQTYECDYDKLDLKALECSSSWKQINPEWEYIYVSGKEREQFVLKNFGKEESMVWKIYVDNSFQNLEHSLLIHHIDMFLKL